MRNHTDDDALLASLAHADSDAGPPPRAFIAKVRRRRWARRARAVGANVLIFGLAVAIWASISTQHGNQGGSTTPPPGQKPVIISASHARPTLWDLRQIDPDAQLLPGELSDAASDGSSL